MAKIVERVHAALKEMRVAHDPKSKKLGDLFLDKADALIADAGGPEYAAIALTESQISLYNDLLEGGTSYEEAATASAAGNSKISASSSPYASKKGQAGSRYGTQNSEAEKSKSGRKGPIGRPARTMRKKTLPSNTKTPRGVKVEKIAAPVDARPREVRKVYTRVNSVLDVLKAGGGTVEELIVKANIKYQAEGGKGNIKESKFYVRVITQTLYHLGLIVKGEDKILTIRQEW